MENDKTKLEKRDDLISQAKDILSDLNDAIAKLSKNHGINIEIDINPGILHIGDPEYPMINIKFSQIL